MSVNYIDLARGGGSTMVYRRLRPQIQFAPIIYLSESFIDQGGKG